MSHKWKIFENFFRYVSKFWEDTDSRVMAKFGENWLSGSWRNIVWFWGQKLAVRDLSELPILSPLGLGQSHPKFPECCCPLICASVHVCHCKFSPDWLEFVGVFPERLPWAYIESLQCTHWLKPYWLSVYNEKSTFFLVDMQCHTMYPKKVSPLMFDVWQCGSIFKILSPNSLPYRQC